MSSLEIQVEPLEGVEKGALVHLEGALDQPTLGAFLSQLKAVLDDGKVRALLDMQGVTYANSTALGALVTQADAFRDAGGQLALLRPQPKVNLVIEMLGLNAVLQIFRSVEEARPYLALAAEPVAAEPQEPAGAAPPPQASSFPLRADCCLCGVVLEFSQPGRFRCPHCGAVYAVDGGGRVSGSKPRGGQPLELALTCSPQVLRAFGRFVGALPSWDGYGEEERAGLESAIAEVCQAVCLKAYEGNEQAAFHVLVVCRGDELAVRIADHGKPLASSDFPIASQYMSEFEHRSHPSRGNVVKMTRRAP